METPICVIDARTLVDHIQELKHWIYSGQLRLVVPTCTIVQVEQLYQKSIEPKPIIQEAPRSRSSGKPPKKEYPAFDINPRVAREYLGRLKSRKEQDADSEHRAFFLEKENHEAVYFQQPSEQYTPWKDLDLEDKKPEAVDGPPSSWAEALRRRQNLANGSPGQLSSKAPAKPKLVARAAGSESSPWKVKKDAPKISAQDVPGALRPLMSCALWRLHESIERNDPNQLFLLSDHTEIQSVAQKLNVTVRSCKEVAATIASRTYKTDLEAFGDLEKIFGVQQKIVIPPTEDVGEANGKHSASDNADEDLLKDVDAMNHSVTSEGTANTEASSIVHEQDYKKQDFERESEKSLANADRCEDEVKEQDMMAETAKTLAPENVSKTPVKSVESIKSLVDSIIQQDLQKHVSGTVNDLKLDNVKGQGSLAGQPALEHSVTRSSPGTLLPQPQSVESVQRSQEVQAISDSIPPIHTGTPSTTIGEAAQESEDSDEEVVVFVPQPKRFSAQRNPAQQGSRPSTPKEQAQQKPTVQSPETSLAKPQPKGRAMRHSPKPSVLGHVHPQPVNSPTVIDPDAFGRDFRVNLNSSPRLSHNPNGHSSHRKIRGNIHNAQVGQVPRNLPRHLARTSPPRNAPQESSRRPTVVNGRPVSKDAPNQRSQASRTSPRRSPAPKVEEVALSGVESRATTVAELSKSHLPGPRTVESTDFDSELPTVLPGWNSFESTDFVPRSAIPNAELKSNGPQPRIYDPGEFVSRPSRPVREFKQRPTKPKVFEAAEFVPRDFVPRTTVPRAQPRPHSPEPESIEPRPSINDVDFVLKSGSTRASARGKGRLWTPS